tara:strand:+ start:182 stop:2170 length:1989 start_codon:yes stop_codon:yes gene_type:complete
MIDLHKKDQNDPGKKEIEFILNLFNSNKFVDTNKEIHKLLIKYKKSSVLYNILGAAKAAQNFLEESVENYKKALSLNPKYAQAYNNLGVALQKLKKIDEAIENYNKAINLKNDFAEAYNNLGSAIKENNELKNSLFYFEKAIKIKSDYAEAYYNKAATCEALGEKTEAISNYKKAINSKPDYVQAYNDLGNILSDLSRFDESLEFYKKALEIKPEYEKTYNNFGNLLHHLGKHDEATNAYHKAIKIKPDYANAYSNLLLNLNYKLDLDPKEYLEEAKKFGINCKSKKEISIKYKYEKNPNILKIGFVSADFGNHPGGYFSLSTIRELRKRNFKLYAYPTVDRNDELSHHFKSLFTKWNSIKEKNDKEAVEQISNDGIHILMDLQGHTADNRLPIFIYKPAPIQISWLSQGTLGISEIDYLIGSPHTIPSNEENHFIEKILRLPEITQCFTEPNYNLEVNTLPALKNKFITFGCVNKLTKINDDVINLWSKILLSIPNSKLLLKNRDFDDPNIIKTTLSRFKKNNIEENRIIFQGKSKTRKEVLEIYKKIDIALDPYPFQGNTSTCESVWMGVPVIILKGNRFMFHFGESINSNLNMPEWIAKNKDDYIFKAKKFATNIEELSRIRKNLREIAIKSPVFNAKRFASYLENAFWNVWKKFSNSQ